MRKWLDQQRQVLDPLAERRQVDRDDVEPVVQVLAEPAGGDGLAEVLVGRGEDPAVGLDHLAAADPLERPVLEDAEELGLHPQRQGADLVEQERPAARPARTGPCFCRSAPVNAPCSWPKNSLSSSDSGIAAAVDGDQRPGPGRVVVVDRLGDQFLAGARSRP